MVGGLTSRGNCAIIPTMKTQEIRQLRKRLGLTQKELAARVRVDAITVSRWERSEQQPSQLAQRQLERLAKKV